MNVNEKTSIFVNRKKFWGEVRRDWQLYLLILPAVLWLIIWKYVPFYGMQIAFKDYSIIKGITDSPWVGWKNFQDFFGGVYVWRVIRNTITINVYNLVATFPITILLALLINELRSKKFKSMVQTSIYLPHFISSVVVAGIVISFLSPTTGVINNVIEKFGGERTYFLIKPEFFQTIYVVMGGWQGIGFATILYTSALCGIDEQLYEAAAIDGAGKWKRIIHVAIPGIMPTIGVNLILKIGNMMKSTAGTIILLYQPITYETADTIATYVYRSGLIDNNFSLATAVGLFEGVVAFLLVWVANKISKRVSETSVW